MSVEERYRSLPRIANEARSAGFNVLLHTDIDMYFRRPLTGLINIVRTHDISIRFRENLPENNRVLEAYMGFSLNNATEAFLATWAKHIDSIEPKDKPRGFGQTSFYRAYLEHTEDCSWGRLDVLPGSTIVSKSRDPNADIWVGNSNQGRNRKSRTASIFAEDLKEIKRDPHSYVGSKTYRLYHYPSYTKQTPTKDFDKTVDAIRRKWAEKIEGGSEFNLVIGMDVFFTFLPQINALLQINACQSMIDLGSPNPYRFDEKIVLTDAESQRSYKGAQSYFGMNNVVPHRLLPHDQTQIDADAVCFAGLLEHLPAEDVPWVEKEAFALSIRLCIFVIELNQPEGKSAEWWEGVIDGIGNEFPGINYKVYALQRDGSNKKSVSRFGRRKRE